MLMKVKTNDCYLGADAGKNEVVYKSTMLFVLDTILFKCFDTYTSSNILLNAR